MGRFAILLLAVRGARYVRRHLRVQVLLALLLLTLLLRTLVTWHSPGQPPLLPPDQEAQLMAAGNHACQDSLPGWSLKEAHDLGGLRVRGTWVLADSTAGCVTQFGQVFSLSRSTHH